MASTPFTVAVAFVFAVARSAAAWVVQPAMALLKLVSAVVTSASVVAVLIAFSAVVFASATVCRSASI